MVVSALCSACSLTDTRAAAHRLVSHIQPDLPVFRGYRIERKQDYPISKATPLFVAGDDREKVSALAGQLSVYFLSVEAISDTATLRPGFILKFASRTTSTNKNIILTLADTSDRQVFDTLNIVVEDGASEAEEKRRLNAALSRAAALLAGES
ncbi:MAG: hypothetical protein KJP25_00445 [Gammaproteobacteria bacterium]|nr:hypothetical protein [Gammaproteobacteria bacterium]MBT8151287.1 hypothetical protein [Gammaproteobacteria bacterium]NND38727.1 hypothetical protein [Pseudomonadales bacterium]